MELLGQPSYMCEAFTKLLCKAYTCKINSWFVLVSDLACIVYEMDGCTSFTLSERVMIMDRIQLNVFKAFINTL